MSKPVKKVRIKRSRWSSPYTNKGSGYNKLYVSSSKRMCCLGFCAREAGLSVEQIRDVASPDYLDSMDREKFYTAFPGFTTEILDELVLINDDDDLTRSQREARLQSVARQGGVQFEFVD